MNGRAHTRTDQAQAAFIRLAESRLVSHRGAELLPQCRELLNAQHCSERFLDVAERLCDQANDLTTFELVLECRLRIADSPITRARALERLADFLYDCGNERTRAHLVWKSAAEAYARDAATSADAIQLYERVLAAFPDDVESALRLSGLYAARGDFARVVPVFSALISAASDTATCTELVLELEPLAERAGASDIFIQIIDELLWRLGNGDTCDAHLLLAAKARCCARTERYREAATLYETLKDEAPELDCPELREDLAALHIASGNETAAAAVIAELESLGDTELTKLTALKADLAALIIDSSRSKEAALELVRTVLAADPKHVQGRELALKLIAHCDAAREQASELFESLGRKTRDPHVVIDGYQELLNLDLSATAAEYIAKRLVQFTEPRVSDPRILARALERLLVLAPHARWAFDRVKVWLNHDQEWEKLFTLYDNVLAVTDNDAERAVLLEEAALVARDVASDTERAIGYFEDHLALVPDNARAASALERLYEREGRTLPLITLLSRRVTAVAEPLRAQIKERIARSWLDLGDATRAIPIAEELFAAEYGAARELLERIVEASGTRNQQPWSVIERGAELLKAHFSSLGQSADVARILELELEHLTRAPAERGILLGVLREAATLYTDELGNTERAAELLTRIVDAAPELEERKAAARTLSSLLLVLGRPEQRCRLLEELAEMEAGWSRQQARREAARVALDELCDPERAAHNYRRVLDQAPRDRAAHNGLVQALETAQNWSALADALLARVEVTEEPSQQREDLTKAARLFAGKLGNPLRAIELWTLTRTRFGSDALIFEAQDAAALFESAPELLTDDPSLAIGIAQALQGHEDFVRAEAILRRQLTRYARRHLDERKRVQLELAKLLALSGRRDAALAELVATAKLYPADPDVQLLLAQLALEHGQYPRAEHSLRALLLVLGATAHAKASVSRAEVYGELSYLKTVTGEPAEAAELMHLAFEAARESEQAAAGLEAALRRRERDQELERALTRHLELVSDVSTAFAIEQELSELRLTLELGRLLELVELAEQPAECEAALNRAGELLHKNAQVSEHSRYAKRIQLHAAELFIKQRDFERARQTLEALLARDPRNVTIIRRLAGLAQTRGAPFRATELYARALELATDAERKVVASELSRACDEALKLSTDPDALELYDAEELLAALDTAQAQERTCVELTLLRAHILDELGRCPEAIVLLRSFLELPELRRTRTIARVFRKLADLHLANDEIAEALPELVHAHQHDKTDLETAVLLGLVAIDLDRTDTATSAFRAAIANKRVHSNSEGSPNFALSQAYFQLAQIEHSRGMKTSARHMLLRAVEADPKNRDAARRIQKLHAS